MDGQKNEEEGLVFTVNNFHIAHSGRLPEVNANDSNKYFVYFASSCGDQTVLIYVRKERIGPLRVGDSPWSKDVAVVNEVVEGLYLDPDDQTWLEACRFATISGSGPMGGETRY